jgi:hypothetical protein
MGDSQRDQVRWVLIEPGVLVRLGHGQVSGMVVYGNISAERLRSIRLSSLEHIAGNIGPGKPVGRGKLVPVAQHFPEWVQINPPTPDEAKAAEIESAALLAGRSKSSMKINPP